MNYVGPGLCIRKWTMQLWLKFRQIWMETCISKQKVWRNESKWWIIMVTLMQSFSTKEENKGSSRPFMLTDFSVLLSWKTKITMLHYNISGYWWTGYNKNNKSVYSFEYIMAILYLGAIRGNKMSSKDEK